MKRAILPLLAAALLGAAPAAAQGTISTGMTPDQVRAAFGTPATVRVAGEWAYWFYHNGCPVRCGSDDVVFFRGDRVVSAVLRTRARRFTGGSANDALEAAGSDDDAGTATLRVRGDNVDAGATTGGSLRVGGIRVRDDAGRDAAAPASGDVIIIPSTARARERGEIRDTVTVVPRDTSSVDRAHQRNVERADTTSVDRAHQRNLEQQRDTARVRRP
ncbi:MAG TPA: hypothetical protein VFQ45_17300 [Longimicrobium sp.]|nr:hypothetical protein [Longimicrobium sp.]